LGAAVTSSISGKRLHPMVEQYLSYIKGLPLTEERGEQPHAEMTKERGHTAVAVRPWRAATARLSESLQFVRTLGEQDLAQLAVEWGRYSRILQVNPEHQYRCRRLKQNEIFSAVYENMYRTFTGVSELTSNWQRLEVTGEEATYSSLLQCEYFKATLKDKCYYSIGAVKSDLQLFQVVWIVPPKKRWVASSSSAVPHSVLDICLQFFEPWAMDPLQSDDRLPAVIETTRPNYSPKICFFFETWVVGNSQE